MKKRIAKLELFLKSFLGKLFLLVMSKFSLYHLSEFFLKYKLRLFLNIKDYFYEDDRVRLRYWAGGPSFGETLVFIHGFGSGGIHQTQKQVEKYAKKYRIVVPDLVYFGKSISKVAEYSLEFQVESVMKILNFLKIDKFTVIGNSYGGLIATILTDENKERVTRLVIIDSPIKEYSLEIANKAAKELGATSIDDLLIPKTPEGVNAIFNLVRSDATSPLPAIICENLYKNLFNICTKQKKEILDYLKNNQTKLNRRKWHFKIPILLVWGEKDKLIPVSIGYSTYQYFKKYTKNVYLEIISNAAHAPHIERSVKFNRILTNFLEKK